LENASDLVIYPASSDALTSPPGKSVTTAIPDKISDRLLLDTTSTSLDGAFEKISINLGATSSDLQSLLIDVSQSDTDGTNWINYDLRSLEKQLGISDFSDTTFEFQFGLGDSTPIVFVDAGDITQAQGLIQIDDADISAINAKTGNVFLVINFDSSNNSSTVGTVSGETDTQPIVIDFFSFGEKNNQAVNNAIYRFELEETSVSSGIFTGTFEFAITNQLNLFDSDLINTLKPIDENVKFLVNDRLIGEEGVAISYSDISEVGVSIVTSSKSEIVTHSGKLGLDSSSYRFGQTVIVSLIDYDLNLDSKTVDVYQVVDDTNSSNVDAVGESSGEILLEVLIKDFRYKRCTISGQETGGLSATGFKLVETGPSSGAFQGSFKMPSSICNESGTEIITTGGTKIEVEYHDFRDSSGVSNIFSSGIWSLTSQQPAKTPIPTSPAPEILIPTSPAPEIEERFPDWIKNNASWWSEGAIDDSDFVEGIQFMIKEKIINIPDLPQGSEKTEEKIPNWIRNNAGWWSDGLISDDDFINGIQFLVEKGIIRVS